MHSAFYPRARILCFLMAFVLTFLCVPCAGAQDRTTEKTITVGVITPSSATPLPWDFPYSDDYFKGDQNVYDHRLAQASLGLTFSAFRDQKLPEKERDAAAREYMATAGFDAVTTEQFDITPTIDTIATVIGKKQIDDFTLVAVAVSGAGYGNEWLSNFTIGDETRHQGFNDASQKVQARIRAYLTEYGITGKVKLWISGYSRAAAVSNLTAADMTSSGLFDSVFAYTFATPRTVRNPENYTNIFNIVGKFDPVPTVPLAEWGYERYGISLYTPAQETDEDYVIKKEAADKVHQQLTGIAFYNNVDINNTLHQILSFLYAILPTSKDYVDHMQDLMKSAWADRSIYNLQSVVTKLMDDKELMTEETQTEADNLLDYLSLVTYSVVTGQVQTGDTAEWNQSVGMVENLAREHMPEVYLSWMFSQSSGDALFNEKLTYTRVVWSGEVTTYVLNSDVADLFSVDEAGKVDYNAKLPSFEANELVGTKPQPACLHKGTQNILVLPGEKTYYLFVESQQDNATMMYYGTEYTVGKLNGQTSRVNFISEMKKGDEHIILALNDELYATMQANMDAENEANGQEKEVLARVTGAESFNLSLWDDEHLANSQMLSTMLETNNAFHLTFVQMLLVIVGAVVVVLVLIIWPTVHYVRKHNKKKRARLAAAASDTNTPNNKEENDHAVNS